MTMPTPLAALALLAAFSPAPAQAFAPEPDPDTDCQEIEDQIEGLEDLIEASRRQALRVCFGGYSGRFDCRRLRRARRAAQAALARLEGRRAALCPGKPADDGGDEPADDGADEGEDDRDP